MHSLLLLILAGPIPLLVSLLRNTIFIISNLPKYFHQDNLSLICLQFDKHSCLNILTGNFLLYTSRESLKRTVKHSHSIGS